jgi:hypothetical protein
MAEKYLLVIEAAVTQVDTVERQPLRRHAAGMEDEIIALHRKPAMSQAVRERVLIGRRGP